MAAAAGGAHSGRRAYFTVIHPSGQRTPAEISILPFLIGRQGDNHLVLRDNRISRLHARITMQKGDLVLEDCNSRHGVFVNGVKISQPRPVSPGDTIAFGSADSYQLILRQRESELPLLVDQMPGEANLAKLRSLLEVARALQASLSTDEVLEAVVDAALKVTGAERGFLLMQEDSAMAIRIARDASGSPLFSDDLHVPVRLIQRALKERRDLLTMSFAPGGPEPSLDTTIRDLDVRSVVCVPLVRVRTEISQDTVAAPLSETVGVLYLDSRREGSDLSHGNREVLQTLAMEASTVLENARLLEHDRVRQRIEQELEIARVIQQSLLPRSLPSEGWLRAAGSSLASLQVGGDFFDVIQTLPDVWSIAVVDVSGKGASSALLAALLQGVFLQTPGTPEAIVAMLDRLNRHLYQRTEGEKYATLFFGSLAKSGLLHWANAGHCAPIIVHEDGAMETLAPNSMPVGMLDTTQFEVSKTSLRPGDRIIMYSDGLSDARDSRGVTFDIPLRTLLRDKAAGLSAAGLHQLILETLAAFIQGLPQRDDVTVLVVEYRPD